MRWLLTLPGLSRALARCQDMKLEAASELGAEFRRAMRDAVPTFRANAARRLQAEEYEDVYLTYSPDDPADCSAGVRRIRHRICSVCTTAYPANHLERPFSLPLCASLPR